MSIKKILLQKKYEGQKDQVIRYGNNDNWEAVNSYDMFITPQILIMNSNFSESDIITDWTTTPLSGTIGCRRLTGYDEYGIPQYDDNPGIEGVYKDVYYLDGNQTLQNGKRVVFILQKFGNYHVIVDSSISDKPFLVEFNEQNSTLNTLVKREKLDVIQIQ